VPRYTVEDGFRLELMPVPLHFPPPGFDDLSIDEKHREVISERLREVESDPISGDSGRSCGRVFEIH
jgi:hypothetical protein